MAKIDDASAVIIADESVNLNIICTLIILLSLYAMYFSPLQTVYYFADEAVLYAQDPPLSLLINKFISRGLIDGRPISMFLYGIMSKIAFTGEPGLQFIRVLQFIASAGTAIFFFNLLRKCQISSYAATFLVVLIWSQPVMQSFHAYSMATPGLIGACSSYLAFSLLYNAETHHKAKFIFKLSVCLLLLVLAWITYQATPFCGLALMSFCVLSSSDEQWYKERHKHALFLGLIFISMFCYIITYKKMLSLPHDWTYPLTESSLSLLSGKPVTEYLRILHPRNYLGPFEWWNYIVPVPKLSDTTFQLFTSLSLGLFLAIGSLAYVKDLKLCRPSVVCQKYVVAFFGLALTFLPLVADNFSFRQRLYIACVPTLVVMMYAFIERIAAANEMTVWPRSIKVLAIALLLVICLGAQANVHRGLVMPNVKFLTFAKAEMDRQKDKNAERLLVVNTPQVCIYEPCRGFMERRMSIANRKRGAVEFYQNLLSRIGKDPNLSVEFVDEREKEYETDDTIVIDYRILMDMVVGKI